MTNIINLRQARKAKKRADKERRAEENRQAFGRTKTEKQRQQTQQVKLEKHLDGHKREKPEE